MDQVYVHKYEICVWYNLKMYINALYSRFVGQMTKLCTKPLWRVVNLLYQVSRTDCKISISSKSGSILRHINGLWK